VDHRAYEFVRENRGTGWKSEEVEEVVRAVKQEPPAEEELHGINRNHEVSVVPRVRSGRHDVTQHNRHPHAGRSATMIVAVTS
jgi:hypothetical protein